MKSHLLHLEFPQRDRTCCVSGGTPCSTAGQRLSEGVHQGRRKPLCLCQRAHGAALGAFSKDFEENGISQSPVLQQLERKHRHTVLVGQTEKNGIRAVCSEQGMSVADRIVLLIAAGVGLRKKSGFYGTCRTCAAKRAPQQEGQRSRCHRVAQTSQTLLSPAPFSSFG